MAVVCQYADVCVLLLISVISTDLNGDAIVFVSQAERWNIGLLVMVELFIWTTGLLLGYVVLVNECLGVDGPSAGNGAMMGEWKWSMLYLLTFLHQQKCYTWFFFYRHNGSWPRSSIAFFFFSSPTTLHNKTFSTCSDICWWIDLHRCSNIVVCHDDASFGGIDHLKLLRLRQFMPTAWQ